MKGKTEMNSPAYRLQEKGISAEAIYKDMLDNIINLILEPGSLVSENQMAQEYGVSRSVIRTVFARLNQLGFIDIYPQRGSFVSLIDPAYVKNLLILRAAIEKEVLLDVIKHLGKDEKEELLAGLEENMSKQREYREELNYSGEFESLDTEFHNMIIDSVGKRAVLNIISDRLLHVFRYRNFDMTFVNRIHNLVKEHEQIIEAIKNNDVDMACETIDRHLEDKVKIAKKAIRNYSQYFVNL